MFLRDGNAAYHTYSAYNDEVDLSMLDRSYLHLAPWAAAGRAMAEAHDRYSAAARRLRDRTREAGGLNDLALRE